MSDSLQEIAVDSLAARYQELALSLRHLAKQLSEDQFWQKPFNFGNSFGHLVLHLTGNLNYYIGAEIGKTGYVRDRPLEFTETSHIPKDEALKRFDDAIAIVVRTLKAQSPEDWAKSYTAKGEETASNRFTIFLRCATHLHHHIGEMTYLCFAHQK